MVQIALFGFGVAHAQVFEDPTLPPPVYGIEAPTVVAPTNGTGILWPWKGVFGFPTNPDITFEFWHGGPYMPQPGATEAEWVLFCAYVYPSTSCDQAYVDTNHASQQIAIAEAIAPVVNRSLRVSWTNLVLGYDFSWTVTMLDGTWRGETVSYQIGACDGEPPLGGPEAPDWIHDHCAFSETRTFDLTEEFVPWD